MNMLRATHCMKIDSHFIRSVAGSVGFLVLIAAAARSADEPATKPAGRQITVITTKDEKVTGPLLEFKDGVLEIGTNPPQSLSLMDVQKLTFGTAAGVHAMWLGQDQHDFVQVGSAQGGNGIQDVHLRIAGLTANKEIKQLRIVCRTPPRAWLLDPTDSPNWRLMVDRRLASSIADVYFEPPSNDLIDKELQLTLTYGDDSTEKLTCLAETHTSDQLHTTPSANKSGSTTASSGDSTATNPTVAIDLATGDSLQGNVVDVAEEMLTLRAPWQPSLQVPLSQVRGLVANSASAPAKKLYRDRKAKPGTEDLALVTAKDGTLAEISGHLKKGDGQEVKFVYEGEERNIQSDRLQGIVFAAQPRGAASADPYQVVHLISGDTISGNWTGVADNRVALKMPWGATWQVPIENVAEIDTRNGNLVELSDLTPITVEQTPFFGRVMAYQGDQSLDGGSLKVKGKVYAKGLAVHSRCLLTYALDGQFANFKTLLGFDDAAGNRGQVACRVVADGKELYANRDFRAEAEPQELDLSVAGAKQLTLEVDFGDNEDIGDRVIWAEARLFRK
jgi:NPCBM/NEW2 domain